MARTLHWFWREVVVGVGVAEGLFARFNIAPTQQMLELVGALSEPVLAVLTALNLIPLLFAGAWSFEYGHIIGLAAFLAGGWAGYILPSNPNGGLLMLFIAGGLAIAGPTFKKDILGKGW